VTAAEPVPYVGFVFPGQGAQLPGMAHALAHSVSGFSKHLSRLLDLPGCGGRTLGEDWADPLSCEGFDHADHSQPMLLALGMALAHELAHRGVAPHAVVGHSVGEIAAAWVAGVFGADQDAALVRSRQNAVRVDGNGAMLAVPAAPDDVRPHLVPGAVIGAFNARRQVVVSGRPKAVAATADRLRAAGHAVQLVRSDRAFHSPQCAGAARRFTREVERLAPAPARLPLFSGLTGTEANAEQSGSPMFWGRQLAEPVHFDAAVTSLLDSGTKRWVLVEMGPSSSIRAVLRRHPSVRSGTAEVVSVLPPADASAAQCVDHVDRLAERLLGVMAAGTSSRTSSPPSSRH